MPLRATTALPSGVFGPVLFRAFAGSLQLAWISVPCREKREKAHASTVSRQRETELHTAGTALSWLVQLRCSGHPLNKDQESTVALCMGVSAFPSCPGGP